MSANPHRTAEGRVWVLLQDKKTQQIHEETGLFGLFYEAVGWARENGFEVRVYTALA